MDARAPRPDDRPAVRKLLALLPQCTRAERLLVLRTLAGMPNATAEELCAQFGIPVELLPPELVTRDQKSS